MAKAKRYTTIPLWQRPLITVIGYDYKELLKVGKAHCFSKRTMDEIEIDKASAWNVDGCAYFCEETGTALLYFPTHKIKPEILVHEITHVVDELMIFLNAIKEHEARAHTAEWLFIYLSNVLKSSGS